MKGNLKGKSYRWNPPISRNEKKKLLFFIFCIFSCYIAARLMQTWVGEASQRAKFAKKVHKPPLRVNAINFELNGFNASIWVPWSPSHPKKSWCTDRKFQSHKICVKKVAFCTYSSIWVKSLHRLAWIFWRLWFSKWNAEDMYKIQNLA